MYKILLVEDDVQLCEIITDYFTEKSNNDINIFCATDGASADELLYEHNFDIILLDVMLPDTEGFSICRQIRSESDIPIIFITARHSEEDVLYGYSLGCDDYISKPFSVEILYQRIKAVLRRSQTEKENDIFTYKELSVDFSRMLVMVSGSPVKLSATEYKLLELLIKNKGQVLTRNRIIEKIWDCNENYIDENTLNVHIRRLRQKIETDPKNPQLVVTVFGIGYTFGE